MRMAMAGLALALLAGCSPTTGEPWAKDRLGAAGAEQLRQATARALGLDGMAMPESMDGVYLPRPFVLFDAVTDERGQPALRYSPTNKRLKVPPTSAAAVRAAVELSPSDVVYRHRGKRLVDHVEYEARIYDLASGKVGTTRVERADTVLETLEALPSQPP